MRSPPGTTWAIGLSALLIGGLALTLNLRDRNRLPSPAAPACPAASQLEVSWNEASRDAVRQRFAAHGELPYADATRRTVVRLLDEAARDWKRARAETCNSSPAATDDRVRCLDQVAMAFSATVEALTDTSVGRETAMAIHAVDAVRTLPPVDVCTWGHVPALPTASATTLAVLAAHTALGRPEVTRAALPALTQRPDVDPATAGRAFALEASVGRLGGEAEAAGSLLERSLWAAIEQRDDVQVVPAALGLAELAAAEGDPARTQRWWRLASAWTTRFGRPTELTAGLVRSQAQLLTPADVDPAALDVLATTLGATASIRPHDPGAALDLTTAARLAAHVRTPEEALALHERAMTAIERHFGPGHPHGNAAQLHFARALRQRGGPLAGAAARRVLQTWLERPDGPALPLDVAAELGRWAVEDDVPAEAVAALRQALASRQAAGIPAEERLPTQIALARALAWSGDGVAAEQVWGHVMSTAHQVYGRDDPRTAEIELAWAEALHAQAPADAYVHARLALERGLGPESSVVAWLIIGSAAQALNRGTEDLAAYEYAEALARAAEPPIPGRLATVQLALASAAWAHGQRGRASAIVDAIVPRDPATPGDGPTAADLDDWRARRNVAGR